MPVIAQLSIQNALDVQNKQQDMLVYVAHVAAELGADYVMLHDLGDEKSCNRLVQSAASCHVLALEGVADAAGLAPQIARHVIHVGGRGMALQGIRRQSSQLLEEAETVAKIIFGRGYGPTF